MDATRFDALARTLAVHGSRRRLLGGLVAGMLTWLLRGGSAVARVCSTDGRVCSKHAHCCSGYCRPRARRRGRRTCAACESGIVCGNACCPDDALNGCAVVQGPNGPVATCLCPDGTRYDPVQNECRPCGAEDAGCRGDGDCCSESCCGGACCAEGASCCDGTCCDKLCCGDSCCGGEGIFCCGDDCCLNTPPWTCHNGRCCRIENVCGDTCCDEHTLCNDGKCQPYECPAGTECAGPAVCGEYSTEEAGLCCQYPSAALCTCDGTTRCCTPEGPNADCFTEYDAVVEAPHCCHRIEDFPDCCYSCPPDWAGAGCVS